MCETVDLGTECREHAAKLVNTFRGDRDYAGWCGEFYTWFKQKHGDLCPEQCNKFMCKPKCEWMDDIAALDSAEAELMKQEENDAALLRKVRTGEEEVTELNFQHQQVTGRMERSKTYVERAETKVADSQARLEEAQNATAKALQKSAAMDQAIADAEQTIVEAKDNMTQLGYSIDSTKIEADGKKRDASRMRQLAREAEEELLVLVGVAENAGDKVSALEAKLETEQADIADLNTTQKAARAKIEGELSTVSDKERSQKEQLKEMREKVNKTAADETQIKMEEVLLKETSTNADKLMTELAALVKEEKKLSRRGYDTKYMHKDLDRAKDDEMDVMAKAEALNGTTVTARADAAAADKAAENKTAEVAGLEAAMLENERNLNVLTKAKETAEVNARFAHEALDDKEQNEAQKVKRLAKVQKDLEYEQNENTAYSVEAGKLGDELTAFNATQIEDMHNYDVAHAATISAKESLAAERKITEESEPGP